MAHIDSILCRSHLHNPINPRKIPLPLPLTLTLTPSLPSSSSSHHRHLAPLSHSPPLMRRTPLLCATSSSQDSAPFGDDHEHDDSGYGDGDDSVNPASSDRAEDQRPEIDRALHLDGQIPPTSDGFLRQVSSRAYDVRRRFEQSIDTSSYDVLESNPWRGNSKPVYVLAQEENKLLTMRTRRVRNEVENELNLLFPKRDKRRGSSSGILRSPSKTSTALRENHFSMIVEDVREGVLVFEDEEEATKYCNLLDGEGKGCMGVAELDASDVFALCNNIKAFAVLFRRGITPPLPERLQMNLKAKKRSLED